VLVNGKVPDHFRPPTTGKAIGRLQRDPYEALIQGLVRSRSKSSTCSSPRVRLRMAVRKPRRCENAGEKLRVCNDETEGLWFETSAQ
jgi:hypothetical protein